MLGQQLAYSCVYFEKLNSENILRLLVSSYHFQTSDFITQTQPTYKLYAHAHKAQPPLANFLSTAAFTRTFPEYYLTCVKIRRPIGEGESIPAAAP